MMQSIKKQRQPVTAQAFPLRGHNNPGDCCGFYRQCGSFADATGKLQRWWQRASHGSPLTDEVELLNRVASLARQTSMPKCRIISSQTARKLRLTSALE